MGFEFKVIIKKQQQELMTVFWKWSRRASTSGLMMSGAQPERAHLKQFLLQNLDCVGFPPVKS